MQMSSRLPLFVCALLFALFAFGYSNTASATPAVFCEDTTSTPGVWDKCADAPYSYAEHKHPAPGTWAAGLQTCDNMQAPTRCTYPASAAEGFYTSSPPPAEIKTVDNALSFSHLFGQIVDAFKFPASGSPKAVFSTSDRSTSDINNAVGQPAPPTTKTPSFIGGTFTVTPYAWSATSTQCTSIGYPAGCFNNPPPVSAANEVELVAKMQVLPEPPYKYGGNISSVFSPAMSLTTSRVFVNGAPVLKVVGTSSTGSQATTYVPVSGHTTSCPAGYTLNDLQNLCQLTDIDAAKSDPMYSDGICNIVDGQINPFDPECPAMQAQGKLRLGTTSDGRPAVTVTDPTSGISLSQTKSNSAVPATTLSKLTQDPNTGNAVREDITVPKKGTPGPASNVAYPGTPPPAYEGDTGAGNGGGVSGGSAVSVPCGGPGQSPCSIAGLDGLDAKLAAIKSGQCGGPSQPPCNVAGLDMTGLEDAIKKNGVVGENLELGSDGADAEAAAGEATAADGIFSSILEFRGVQLPDPGIDCATAWDTSNSTTLDFGETGGHSIDAEFNLADTCPLVEPHEATIRSASLSAWYLLAILLFILLTI